VVSFFKLASHSEGLARVMESMICRRNSDIAQLQLRTHAIVVNHRLFKRAGLVFRVGEILLFVRITFEHVFANGFDCFNSL